MTIALVRNKPSKKDKERRWLEQFRRAYQGEFPAGTVQYSKNPDVLISDAAWTTGIEITEFHLMDGSLPESEPQQALRRIGVTEEAQRLYLANGGRNIEFTFGFGFIGADRRRQLPAELAEFAKRAENNKKETIRLEGNAAPKEVAFAWNSGAYPNAVWRSQQVNRGSITSKGKLIDIVRNKERKVRGYQKCDAYWLLIGVNFFDPAQDQEIRIDDPFVPSDVFDKILLYKNVFDHIISVKS